MQPAPSLQELYPLRQTGFVFLIMGSLLMIVALILGGSCGEVGGNYCNYPFIPGSIGVGVVGFFLILASLLMVLQRVPPPVPQVVYSTPAWVPNYPSMAAPPPGKMVACKNCARVYPADQFGYCPACGTKLGA